MNYFEAKYGKKEDNKTKQYHKSRRMFAINNGRVYIADKNIDYSHAEWFKKLGWIDEKNDNLFDKITRGALEPNGLYFYKGYEFKVDEGAEKDIMLHLSELIIKLKVSPGTHLLGGKVFDQAGNVSHLRDYGRVDTLIASFVKNH